MFTGIIDHCGTIEKIINLPNSSLAWIKSDFSDLVLGESIATDGICLTVKEINNTGFSCDISSETLSVTTANKFAPFQKVNLERALLLTSRLGGHMVSGHIDQICRVKSIERSGDFLAVSFDEIKPENMCLLNKKGSITVNGVSLTLNEIIQDGFVVMLVPHTLATTNLSGLVINAYVNIEFDMVARMIVNQVKKYIAT